MTFQVNVDRRIFYRHAFFPRIASMTFAELLKAQREAAGLTQKELAEKAGITQGVVTNYELAKREPTWAAVQKLADALGVSVTTFRESDDAEADPPPALKKPKPKKSNK